MHTNPSPTSVVSLRLNKYEWWSFSAYLILILLQRHDLPLVSLLMKCPTCVCSFLYSPLQSLLNNTYVGHINLFCLLYYISYVISPFYENFCKLKFSPAWKQLSWHWRVSEQKSAPPGDEVIVCSYSLCLTLMVPSLLQSQLPTDMTHPSVFEKGTITHTHTLQVLNGNLCKELLWISRY